MDKNPKIIMTCLISIFVKILIRRDVWMNLPCYPYIIYHLIMVISMGSGIDLTIPKPINTP